MLNDSEAVHVASVRTYDGEKNGCLQSGRLSERATSKLALSVGGNVRLRLVPYMAAQSWHCRTRYGSGLPDTRFADTKFGRLPRPPRLVWRRKPPFMVNPSFTVYVSAAVVDCFDIVLPASLRLIWLRSGRAFFARLQVSDGVRERRKYALWTTGTGARPTCGLTGLRVGSAGAVVESLRFLI